MIGLLIIIEILEIVEFIRQHQEYVKSINILHLECEGYLHALHTMGAIPEKQLKDKLEQMNKKYGQVSMRLK